MAKPVRVRASSRAYLRANDGDYELSQVEEQAFLANREMPRFDQAAVAGATVDGDLDQALIEAYLDSCRSSSASLVRLSDADILFRTGVTTGHERTPTLAGLLALGIHPQQFAPNAVCRCRPRFHDVQNLPFAAAVFLDAVGVAVKYLENWQSAGFRRKFR
jgi:ATP-dependent DNA helicase RecG